MRYYQIRRRGKCMIKLDQLNNHHPVERESTVNKIFSTNLKVFKAVKEWEEEDKEWEVLDFKISSIKCLEEETDDQHNK
jgi:hypothetical protein